MGSEQSVSASASASASASESANANANSESNSTIDTGSTLGSSQGITLEDQSMSVQHLESQRTDVLPQRTDTLPQRDYAVYQRADAMHQRMGTMPQRTNPAVQCTFVKQTYGDHPVIQRTYSNTCDDITQESFGAQYDTSSPGSRLPSIQTGSPMRSRQPMSYSLDIASSPEQSPPQSPQPNLPSYSHIPYPHSSHAKSCISSESCAGARSCADARSRAGQRGTEGSEPVFMEVEPVVSTDSGRVYSQLEQLNALHLGTTGRYDDDYEDYGDYDDYEEDFVYESDEAAGFGQTDPTNYYSQAVPGSSSVMSSGSASVMDIPTAAVPGLVGFTAGISAGASAGASASASASASAYTNMRAQVPARTNIPRFSPQAYISPITQAIGKSETEIINTLEMFCGGTQIGVNANGEPMYDSVDQSEMYIPVMQLFSHCVIKNYVKAVEWIVQKFVLLQVSIDDNFCYHESIKNNNKEMTKLIISHPSFEPSIDILDSFIADELYEHFKTCINHPFIEREIFKYRYTLASYIDQEQYLQLCRLFGLLKLKISGKACVIPDEIKSRPIANYCVEEIIEDY